MLLRPLPCAQLGAVVATPMLTQLLLGTLVPVDAKALLVSTLQVGRWLVAGGLGGSTLCSACKRAGVLHCDARQAPEPFAAVWAWQCAACLPTQLRTVSLKPQVVLLPVLVGAAINTFFHKQVGAHLSLGLTCS